MILTKEQVLKDLNKLRDIKYQKFSKKITPDTRYNIIGVRVPDLRKLAKEYKKYDVSGYLKDVNFSSLEECELYGMILNDQKFDFYTMKSYLENYVLKIDSWASCDIFCAKIKVKEDEYELFWNLIESYVQTEHEYSVRFGIVMMLCHYLSLDRLSMIFEVIQKRKITPYYIEMAVAWILSECFIRYSEYMLSNEVKLPSISTMTFSKMIQKIKDSKRISEETKEKIKNKKYKYLC